MNLKALAVGTVAASLLALAACGGGGDGEETTTEAAVPCTPVETVDVPEFGEHRNRSFTAADYSTNPPAGGDHVDDALETGRFYTEPPPLGETVHALEHGAVIGWTNGLAPEDQQAVEDGFNALHVEGYESLATVENPEMDVPFALSAWGAVQTCESVDTEVIRPFVEQYYASEASGESFSACVGSAKKLPPCKD